MTEILRTSYYMRVKENDCVLRTKKVTASQQFPCAELNDGLIDAKS